MSKNKIFIELDEKLRMELEPLASEMGISIAEWCALAIEHQLSVQKSLEELSGQMGFTIEEMDIELMTDQLFSFFEDDKTWNWGEIEKPSNIILPESSSTTVKNNK